VRSGDPTFLGTAAVLALGFSAAAQASTIWVLLPDDSGPCSVDRLASLMAAQRTDVHLVPGIHELTGGDALVEISRLGETWTISVRANGQRELVRALPPPGPDCVDLLQTAAFMMARYLDDLHWGDESLSTVRPEKRQEADANPSAWQGVAELSAGALLSSPIGAAPTLRLDVGARAGPWLIELSGIGLPRGRFSAPDGVAASAEVAVLSLAGGRQFGLAVGTLRLELLLGAELAWPTMPLGSSRPEPKFETSPFIGARAGWQIPVYGRLFASIFVEGRALYVGEDEPPAWRSPPFDGDATVGLGYLFF
jgi:hypothetical protein